MTRNTHSFMKAQVLSIRCVHYLRARAARTAFLVLRKYLAAMFVEHLKSKELRYVAKVSLFRTNSYTSVLIVMGTPSSICRCWASHRASRLKMVCWVFSTLKNTD